MTKKKRPEGKNPVGHPPVIDDRVLQELIKAFAGGHTDAEACQIVGISQSTLYNYQNKFPEFMEQKELLKLKPFIKARQTIVNNLSDPEYATWFLERKGKSEFSTRTSVDYSVEASLMSDDELIKAALNAKPPEELNALLSGVVAPEVAPQ